jgi:hypothetical protein
VENNEYEIHMMWIPSHVEVMGNERPGHMACDAVKNRIVWFEPVRPSDFLPLSKVRLLNVRQA